MITFEIPDKDLATLKFYISLPEMLKAQLVSSISSAPAGASHGELVQYIDKSVPNLSDKWAEFIIDLSLNLISTRRALKVDVAKFLEIFSDSLKNSELEGLKLTDEVIKDFEALISSATNLSTTSEVLDLITKNQNVFLDAIVYQDIRPLFDEGNKIKTNVVISNLKIEFIQNKKKREVYLSLDDKDLEKLITSLKNGQDKIKEIHHYFDKLNIVKTD